MGKIKKCTRCEEVKLLSGFHKDKSMSLGRKSECKKCACDRANNYHKTKDGLITRMYSNHKSRASVCKRKNVTYDKKQLSSWILSNSKFDLLYNNWVLSGYDIEKVPSVDRIDDSIGYSLDNLQLVTWKENRKKGNDNIRLKKTLNAGLLNGGHVSVKSTNLITRETNTYISMNEASRVTNVSQSKISLVCSGKRKRAGNYKWEYNN